MYYDGDVKWLFSLASLHLVNNRPHRTAIVPEGQGQQSSQNDSNNSQRTAIVPKGQGQQSSPKDSNRPQRTRTAIIPKGQQLSPKDSLQRWGQILFRSSRAVYSFFAEVPVELLAEACSQRFNFFRIWFRVIKLHLQYGLISWHVGAATSEQCVGSNLRFPDWCLKSQVCDSDNSAICRWHRQNLAYTTL